MARFNTSTKRKPGRLPNVAGGIGYSVDAAAEFAGIAFTSFVKGQYYRSWSETERRLKDLGARLDPLFVAQVCHRARATYGLRSISHALAAIFADSMAGQPWARDFFASIIIRPDDITEILAACDGKIPHAMAKGFGDRLSEFDAYQLAKYARFGRGYAWNLNDAVRKCHPKPTDALNALMRRELTNTDTWEAKGNTVDAWRELLSEKRLGYLALLRNLRNIAGHSDPALVDLAKAALLNEHAIRKSRVLPFQYMSAVNALNSAPSFGGQILSGAVADAMDLACDNVPQLSGNTVIMLDQSGSMQGQAETSALFCAALARRCNALVLSFDDRCGFVSNLSGRVLPDALAICRNFRGGGTNFTQAYRYLAQNNIACDRLFVLTDEQHWVVDGSCWSDRNSFSAFKNYCATMGCDPQVWSMDFASYGTSQFPQDKVRQLWGFSEKLFEIIEPMEQDPGAFVKSIRGTTFDRKAKNRAA